ncbi:MAG TPA: PSD1 and planctomycete cytochrome C domain-containing protein [Pirellulaceae bacterium]|nr:PSD1 and planctomycete cytochrome C domain-containing protein [Pirellulaceae bacterium]
MRHLSILVLLLAAPAARAEEGVDYTRQIKPLLKSHCYACHGALKQQGSLRLDTAAGMLKGGDGGPAIVARSVDASQIVERISSTDESTRMPQEGKLLTAQEVALLKAWIAAGAHAPSDEQPEPDPKSHWAFQRVVRPGLPLGDEAERSTASSYGQPIDCFLVEKQRELGLEPVGEAPRNVLLRRLYVDLIGLPPSREELNDFLANESPDAYERAVDRLLASPQHGERWARHWMDVWRYSDWYGRRSVPDVMNSYPHVWRWRDWIVKSLNGDSGYDRMVQAMLAADELWPGDQEQVVATGFIVRNWFKWNYDTWMRDQVEHTGKAFLGLTLNCALCHDHKYDPITQEDYFRFRAIFEPLELRHDRVPGLPDPGPFKKYVYAQSYGPIPHGLVRVFDEKLDAQTFIYSKGDQRLKVEGKPAMPPGVPAALSGTYDLRPISLPATEYYPGLRPFVQEEELAKRRSSVAAAEAAIAAADEKSRPPLEAKVAATTAELASLEARIAADEVRYGVVPGDADAMAKAAAKAEREAKAAGAQAEVAVAEAAEADANAFPDDAKKAAAVKAAADKLAAAKAALTAAQAELTKDDGNYTQLSPVYPDKSTGRRTALAKWITSRENPLTARVAANHVWRWHFGQPLVPTVANFGRNGKPPTHPELLDWLAAELMDGDWTMKRLSRVLVTSETYRRGSSAEFGMRNAELQLDSTADTPHSALRTPNSIDPDNTCVWRFNPARMEAEVIRDSLLAVAGELDQTIGGQEIDHAQGLTYRRRSIYFAHHGESKMELLELFDAPSPTDCYERSTSIRPQQALALSNSVLSREMSRKLAARLTRQVSTDGDFVVAAFEQVLSRSPSIAEAVAAGKFLATQQALYRESAAANDLVKRSRESLVHVLFNHHDFVTVR